MLEAPRGFGTLFAGMLEQTLQCNVGVDVMYLVFHCSVDLDRSYFALSITFVCSGLLLCHTQAITDAPLDASSGRVPEVVSVTPRSRVLEVMQIAPNVLVHAVVD